MDFENEDYCYNNPTIYYEMGKPSNPQSYLDYFLSVMQEHKQYLTASKFDFHLELSWINIILYLKRSLSFGSPIGIMIAIMVKVKTYTKQTHSNK